LNTGELTTGNLDDPFEREVRVFIQNISETLTLKVNTHRFYNNQSIQQLIENHSLLLEVFGIAIYHHCIFF